MVNLEIGFFDKGRPVDKKNVRHRKIDDIKPGGLGTFFIQQIMDAVVFKEGEKPWINHLILNKKNKLLTANNCTNIKDW